MATTRFTVPGIVRTGRQYQGPFVKDPAEVLDYQVNWSEWLAGDEIIASTFTSRGGIIVGATSFTASMTTVSVSGGVLGYTHKVVNTIHTSYGRVGDLVLSFQIEKL
jgi:hypothetical protein